MMDDRQETAEDIIAAVGRRYCRSGYAVFIARRKPDASE